MSFYFPRKDLAEKIAARLSPDPILGTPAGLFLAAPRRTGKSTFLRRDLVPELETRGHFTIYIDLWADKSRDPAQSIAEALVQAIESLASRGERILDALPFRSVSIGGVSVALKAEEGATATLPDLLREISDRAKRDIILIIDEAQDALNTDSGSDAMFALKAARDALNQRDEAPGLYLVFTGSNRDKLSDLVNKSDQAFYGGTVTDFPPLGRPYVEALVTALNPRLAAGNRLDTDDVEAAFTLVGNRPELLQTVIRDHALDLGELTAPDLRKTVTERADALKALRWADHKALYDALTETQQLVLRSIAETGGAFSPYAEATQDGFAKALGRPVTPSEIQKALGALRGLGVIWHRARGLYAIEDRDMREWLLTAL